MTQTGRRFPLMRLSALLLTAGLLLSGCTGGTPAADNSASPLPAESVSPTPTESTDFRKYNAYSDVMSDIYEMDGMLAAYFTVVQDQPEFALVEGMDYSMLEDVFYNYIPLSIIMNTALDYSDEEPVYPEQDALLLELEQPYSDMCDALGELSDYLSFDRYVDDNMAQAAQLHAQIYEAVGPFDQAAWPFVESMQVLDQETEQLELDRLEAEGMNIALYSRMITNICGEMDADVWAQVENAESLPALDMTNLESLYTQYQEAYANLTAAMEDPEQVEKVYSWSSDEYWSDTYRDNFTTAIADVNTAITAFMEEARSQADYSQSYEQFYTAVSELIDQYNTSFV
ncbi:DUF3829 domain-containing protein [Pseudoflavonifractor phocaeensis]|uniref:DUF3829 domain-containing protein n=1 Tax=Pseudoflavonifractor phocaeensis TaxID=1870988 RepID=UPI00195A9ADD|nr:DUF3829 domain-containing protein [Pseudoflavonifractor phocaeensis]MBM6723255.1 DUF3829 domain-containing protein [Pseudoflavonifractor phocaeensis]